MSLQEILIDDLFEDTNDMKIVNSNIYYTNDTIVKCSDVARLYHIYYYKIKMNNFIKKMVNEIDKNNNKTKENIIEVFNYIIIIMLINENFKAINIYHIIINSIFIYGFCFFKKYLL